MSRVQAVDQSGITPWLPFGPRERKLTITTYGDFATAFNAFLSGQVDITDFPLHGLTTDVPSFCSASSVFCTSPTPELEIFQLDIRHDQPFLGVSLQTGRTAPQPSFVLPATTGSGCSLGFGQLTIHLQNQEQGNAPILDSLNKLTISNQPGGAPSATVGDSGGTNPSGTYVFPCILSGIYKVTSSIYGSNSLCSTTAPTVCLSIGSGQAVISSLRLDWNSPSTKQPTQAGVQVGTALAHLLDKPSFVLGLNEAAFFGAAATFDDEQVAPAQNVPNLISNTAECSDHPWFAPCNPVSAYNFVSDNIGAFEWWTLGGQAVGVGQGYSGYADLRAACDDFVKAGFNVVNGANATDCGDVALASLGTSPPSTSAYPHLSNNGQQINFVVRSSVGRKQFGVILGDTINFLFGTPNNGQTFATTPPCTVVYSFRYCNLTFATFASSACVFQDACPWNLYTGGWRLGPVPDHLYSLYHSSFASSFCGGISNGFPTNYPVYCDPQFDTYAAAGEFNPTLSQSIQFFARAAATGASGGMTVPVHTRTDHFVALPGWNFQQCNGSSCVSTQSSLVNILGGGFGAGSGYWSLLNMRQVPGYVPPNPGLAPGGGDPRLIRRGFSQDTFNLSPFQASSPWESEIVSLIYDSMLHPNPLTGGTDGQIVDWQTTSHSSSFNPAEVGCNALSGCVTGVTTQLWHLRNDIKFQDGTPVTANDVAYTIISYRDLQSFLFQPKVASVVSATGLDCGPGQPCKTLQVKLQGQSAFFELDIGTVPIIPKHVWFPFCGDPPSPTSQCADPGFDPMAQGIMIGDGPWECVVPAGFPNAGRIGGSCSTPDPSCLPLCQLGGQIVTTGGKVLLVRYDGFSRCCPDDTSSGLYRLSWADKNNDGVVNILDVADAALHFGQPDPYWVNSNIAPGSTVNIQDLAVVAFYFGHGTTFPFRPSQLTGLDPQIDPFFCPNNGC